MKRYLLFGFKPYYTDDDTTPLEGWNAFYRDYDDLPAVMQGIDAQFYNGPWNEFQVVDTETKEIVLRETDLITPDKYRRVTIEAVNGGTLTEIAEMVITAQIPYENWDIVMDLIPCNKQRLFIERMQKYTAKWLRIECETYAAENA